MANDKKRELRTDVSTMRLGMIDTQTNKHEQKICCKVLQNVSCQTLSSHQRIYYVAKHLSLYMQQRPICQHVTLSLLSLPSVCLSGSLCLSVSACIHQSLLLSVCLRLPLYVYVCICLRSWVSVCHYVCLFLSPFVSLSVCLSPSACLSLSVCLSACRSLSVILCLQYMICGQYTV